VQSITVSFKTGVLKDTVMDCTTLLRSGAAQAVLSP